MKRKKIQIKGMKKDMKIIEKISITQNKIVMGVAITLFSFSCIWMLFESLSRAIFSKSYAISEEVVVFTLFWAIFLALAETGRAGFHIKVDFVVNKLNKKIKWLVKAIASILGCVYCILMAYSAYIFIKHLYKMELISESPLQLPMWAVCLSIVIGSLLMSIFYVEELTKSIKERSI